MAGIAIAKGGKPTLVPKANSAAVRMYRHGHGDCFLVAFRGEGGNVTYVLIDCGLKKNSEIKKNWSIEKIIADVARATGHHIHVVVVTHEHEDHVSGFLPAASSKSNPWDKITIDEVWLAWTEDPDDELANKLRRRFDDTLLGLVDFADGPAKNMAEGHIGFLGEALSFHTGEEDTKAQLAAEAMRLRTADPMLPMHEARLMAIAGVRNKKAIKAIRERPKVVRFLRPDKGPYALPGLPQHRVFALGPPRDEALLLSLDPKGAEEFRFGMVRDNKAKALFGASDGDAPASELPFERRYGIPIKDIVGPNGDEKRRFFLTNYGEKGDVAHVHRWRRIDEDWMGGGAELALRLNSEVNNTSLVLAFQLPNTGKVLLFSGDAQRGSWISWSTLSWQDGPDTEKLTVKKLLAKCVLYKVGHHGSHNATLNGTEADEYANLSWMAHDDFRDEFVAMIPANEPWALALKPVPWRHPLKAIATALQKKTKGRVFQSNEERPERPEGVSEADWAKFERRVRAADHYFECEIVDV